VRVVVGRAVVDVRVEPVDKHRVEVGAGRVGARVKVEELHFTRQSGVFQTNLQQPVQDTMGSVSNQVCWGETKKLMARIVGGAVSTACAVVVCVAGDGRRDGLPCFGVAHVGCLGMTEAPPSTAAEIGICCCCVLLVFGVHGCGGPCAGCFFLVGCEGRCECAAKEDTLWNEVGAFGLEVLEKKKWNEWRCGGLA